MPVEHSLLLQYYYIQYSYSNITTLNTRSQLSPSSPQRNSSPLSYPYSLSMAPIILSPNQPPDRFYKGGARISSLRSESPCSDRQPEDWVASTTCCSGCGASGLGMTTLPDGRLLADAVTQDPEAWLGADHVSRFGADTKLLVKLLDAGERLPVHAHPHADWARAHLGARHGKAETWYMLTGGEVWLGMKEDVSPEELLGHVQRQDMDLLRARMHRIPVEPHQAVYVPPGTLHAIGAGVLMVEVQEPEDLSVLCEWAGFAIDGAEDGHMGLGFQTALTAVDLRGRSVEEIAELVGRPGTLGPVLCEPAREYFELEHVKVSGTADSASGFAVLVVLEGELDLKTAAGSSVALKRGNTVVVPYSDGELTLQGSGDVLIARPPKAQ